MAFSWDIGMGWKSVTYGVLWGREQPGGTRWYEGKARILSIYIVYLLLFIYVIYIFILRWRRKCRSETSDNMDNWKSRGGKSRRGQEKKRENQRGERVRRKKKQVREKVGKSPCTLFFQWFVAPEGRQVGSLKRRVWSQLARGEMKNCTLLARRRFPSQNVQSATCSGHFLTLRCCFAWQAQGIVHLVQSEQFQLQLQLQYNTLHYITLHNTLPQYTTPHYTTLHYTTINCTMLHHTHNYNHNYSYATIHYTSRDYTTLRDPILHYTRPSTPRQCNCKCTTLITQRLQLHYITSTTTAALHHTTSSSCGWGGQPGDHCNHCNHSKKHNSNHLSVHQWIGSAIRDSQQTTSPIGFVFWNFRHRLVRYYWNIVLHIIILTITCHSTRIYQICYSSNRSNMVLAALNYHSLLRCSTLYFPAVPVP